MTKSSQSICITAKLLSFSYLVLQNFGIGVPHFSYQGELWFCLTFYLFIYLFKGQLLAAAWWFEG